MNDSSHCNLEGTPRLQMENTKESTWVCHLCPALISPLEHEHSALVHQVLAHHIPTSLVIVRQFGNLLHILDLPPACILCPMQIDGASASERVKTRYRSRSRSK